MLLARQPVVPVTGRDAVHACGRRGRYCEPAAMFAIKNSDVHMSHGSCISVLAVPGSRMFTSGPLRLQAGAGVLKGPHHGFCAHQHLSPDATREGRGQ